MSSITAAGTLLAVFVACGESPQTGLETSSLVGSSSGREIGFVRKLDPGDGESPEEPTGCTTNPATGFQGGAGTPTNPYRICNRVQLERIGLHMTASFVMTADTEAQRAAR